MSVKYVHSYITPLYRENQFRKWTHNVFVDSKLCLSEYLGSYNEIISRREVCMAICVFAMQVHVWCVQKCWILIKMSVVCLVADLLGEYIE